MDHLPLSIAAIVVLGISAQWLGWRFRIPSILILLIFGFLAGPVSGLVDPDRLLGPLLFPGVSLAVGIILFEGGLNLNIAELRETRRAILRLITIGMVVTWTTAALGAYAIAGLDVRLSLLLGAILTVSGPTVVLPLLKHVRPRAPVDAILKWEGILIDSIGATLAVLIFELILSGRLENPGPLNALEITGPAAALQLLRLIAIGTVLGSLGALLLVQMLSRYWLPEHLENPAVLMLVVAFFTLSNEIQHESGLLTTTVMGLILANQRRAVVRQIIQFKEDIGVLLLSGLFIILAARLRLEDLSSLGLRGPAFLGFLILVSRPLAVLASTLRVDLSWREKLFLAWLAPRGIVAVSVTSLFALRLADAGYASADLLVPLIFIVVIGTVVIYGLPASWLARRLGLSQPDPTGVLVVGAQDWARAIAGALQKLGREVLLVDTNRNHVRDARMEDLPAVYASILSDPALEEIDTSRMGSLLALTSNDEVNSLATLRFAEHFGRSHVFQLARQTETHPRIQMANEEHLPGRSLFDRSATYAYLEQRFRQGAVVKTVKLTREFDFDAFRQRYGEASLPLFLLDEAGALSIFTAEMSPIPRAGQTLIALVDPVDDAAILSPDGAQPQTARA